MALNPEIKVKWLAALRSGKYTQGYDELKNNNKYCCLGVLAEILGILKTDVNSRGKITCSTQAESSYFDIPSDIARDIGLKYQDVLIQMNDQIANFNEIADWIEINL